MANVDRNINIYRLTDLVYDPFGSYQTTQGKLISVPNLDRYQNGVPAKLKKPSLSRLRRAVTYACFAQGQDVYIHKARQYGTTGYSMALIDSLGAPKVLEIDLDGWTGEIGETIRVKARDNIAVAGMLVVIRDVQGNLLEVGQAAPFDLGSTWWRYVTRSRIHMEPFPSVEAIARDLPGNRDSFVIS
ncbi:MAG TPA: hypothetical protein VFY25_05315 [Anaerolineales bacterium]|nr:hypothetical protein [Anaerolineales bacterium]